MNKLHKLLMATTSVVSFNTIFCGQTLVQAQEAALLQCLKEHTSLGISPDTALAQCQKTNLVDCVKRLTTQKYIANSVSESNGRYLIDLGDNETKWLQGGGWRDKECRPNTSGQSRKQNEEYFVRTNVGIFPEVKRYEWFRQGWCKQPQLELDQNYSIDEAKTLCELGVPPKELNKKSLTKSPLDVAHNKVKLLTN